MRGLHAQSTLKQSGCFRGLTLAASNDAINRPMLFFLTIYVAEVGILPHRILNEKGFNFGDRPLADLTFLPFHNN